MGVLSVFIEGLRRTLRYGMVLLILYAASVLTALPFLFAPALSLYGSAYRTALEEAADGIDAWMILELTPARELTQANLGFRAGEFAQSVASLLLFGSLAVGVAPAVGWLSASFLNGGVLLTYFEASQPFRWRRFFWGCWRFGGLFLALGFVQGLLFLSLFILFGAAIILVETPQMWWYGLLLGWTILLGAAGAAFFEIIQVAAVTGGTQTIWQTVGKAASLIRRGLPRLASWYALALAILILAHLAFRAGILRAIPLTWQPGVFLAQQGFVLVRLWARCARLAGWTALIPTLSLEGGDHPV